MIVTITAYKRPELLARCLHSIAAADTSVVTALLISADRHSEAMREEMRRLDKQVPYAVIWCQKTRLGVANHPRTVFNVLTADEACGPICALEEDTIVAPDCFVFADWALRQSGFQFVNLAPGPCNITRSVQQARDNAGCVWEDWELRSPYGWAFTPGFWRQLEPQWNGKIREPYGWDWQLSHLCYREGWRSLTPEVARVYNTGREHGTYDTPSNWDATQRDVVLCQAVPYSIEYKLVSHERPEPDNWPEWVKREVAL